MLFLFLFHFSFLLIFSFSSLPRLFLPLLPLLPTADCTGHYRRHHYHSLIITAIPVITTVILIVISVINKPVSHLRVGSLFDGPVAALTLVKGVGRGGAVWDERVKRRNRHTEGLGGKGGGREKGQ